MKNIQLTLLFFLFTSTLVAQEIWIETGFKGGYGSSFLFNQNIADDRDYRYDLSGGYGFGGKIGVNFGAWHGIALEGMFTNLNQDFNYTKDGVDGKLNNSINWKALNAYLLYRYNRNRLYLEFGPMFTSMGEISQIDADTKTKDASAFYADNYVSGTFGFGGFLAGSNTFSIVLGIRAHYGFQDFISDEGQTLGYPNPNKNAPYDTYTQTNPAYVMATVEFNFGVGHFAKTACHERMRFFGGSGY